MRQSSGLEPQASGSVRRLCLAYGLERPPRRSYPQETTRAMGPTELLPGSQYYRGDSDRQEYSRGHIPDFGDQMKG